MAGRRIDDHSFWAGKGHQYPLPEGGHKLKAEHSADGAASHVGMDYPDTTEAIHRDQEHGIRKAHGHKIKTGYRN